MVKILKIFLILGFLTRGKYIYDLLALHVENPEKILSYLEKGGELSKYQFFSPLITYFSLGSNQQ